MKPYAALVAALATLVISAAALAGNPDPRKCPYSTKPVSCTSYNAKIAARKWLQKKAAQPYLWQGPVNCTEGKTILVWRCSFNSQIAAVGTGFLTVTYRATSTGWHTYITRTLTG